MAVLGAWKVCVGCSEFVDERAADSALPGGRDRGGQRFAAMVRTGAQDLSKCGNSAGLTISIFPHLGNKFFIFIINILCLFQNTVISYNSISHQF